MICVIRDGGTILNILSDKAEDARQVIPVVDYNIEGIPADELDKVFGVDAYITLHIVTGPKDEADAKDLRKLTEKYKLDSK